ncbi:PREDICTED: ankyrin-1-like [Ceratosolen solmsi marchali]|uniref:Ankyrin-1-like n=1 Tax=Ceratosolen solmsi marchali TaxID=326594 RepID=A0AAJ7E2S1_9HYME|nr:PREDICTED: ankyrin-1-like [Ceratosolen solmsi marchali]
MEGYNNGETPLLHVAVANNDVAMVLYYLLSNHDVNAKEMYFGRTPLHIAVRNDNIKMAQILLNCGAAINETTRDNLSALHIAVSNRSKSMVALLLRYNASINPVINFLDKTPLYMAVEYGCLEIVKMLLEAGASIPKATRRNSTLLHVAVRIGDVKMTQLILDNMDIKALGMRDNIQYKTPLDVAVELNYERIVNVLKQQSTDVQQKRPTTKRKFKPNVKNWKNDKVVELLLRNGKRIPVPGLILNGQNNSRTRFHGH